MRIRLIAILVVFFICFIGGLAIVHRFKREDDFSINEITPESEKKLLNNDSDSVVINKFFDLDSDGKNEKLTIKSEVGLPGEENTKIYLNDSQQPSVDIYGFFNSVKIHDMDGLGNNILEVTVLTGHSINMLPYIYQAGNLVRIPMSTDKPPEYLGIVSRNYPEFKDIDGDGVLELLAYYDQFPSANHKTVDVYKFKNNMFQKE